MPEVYRSLESPFAHGELSLLARYRLARRLVGEFDSAILLPNSFKSALIPFFARIPVRIGWQGEHRNLLLTDCRRLDPTRHPLMVQRFVALALAPDAQIPEVPRPRLHVDPVAAQTTAQAFSLDLSIRALALCPGAEFGDAKQWPLEHYSSLCNQAASDGWQVWILGSKNDRKNADEIVGSLSEPIRRRCRVLAGDTSLGQAIDLLHLATGVVTNDSGLMHIAAAVDSPLIALYGSTSSDFTPPLSDRVKSLSTDISCRPCFERTCPLGHRRCLTEILPTQVYRELEDLLVPLRPGV
jgi:heptosyltransferase-2